MLAANVGRSADDKGTPYGVPFFSCIEIMMLDCKVGWVERSEAQRLPRTVGNQDSVSTPTR